MKKTIREVLTFSSVASQWLQAHPVRSRFSYALRKTMKKVEAGMIAYNEAVEDANVEHCLTDEKTGALLITDDHYQFSKEGMKAKNSALRELLRGTIEFEPHYVTDLPTDPELSEIECMAFDGFVLQDADIEFASNGKGHGPVEIPSESVGG